MSEDIRSVTSFQYVLQLGGGRKILGLQAKLYANLFIIHKTATFFDNFLPWQCGEMPRITARSMLIRLKYGGQCGEMPRIPTRSTVMNIIFANVF